MKGVMQWKYKDVAPSSQGFEYFIINTKANPTVEDPYFVDLFNKAGGTRRGVYQFPIVNAKYSVADNVSFMSYFLSGSVQGGLNSGKDMPIMFCGLYLSLDQINEYLGYIETNHMGLPSGWKKALIYLTAENWASKLKGDNVETVAKNIVDRADILLSDWKCTLPGKIAPWSVVCGWEYGAQSTNGGLLQYDPDGIFVANDNPLPTPDPTPTPTPGGGGTTATSFSEIDIDLTYDGKPIKGTIKLVK